MTTIDPTDLERRPLEIKDLLGIKDAEQLELAGRIMEAEVHLLEAKLTHARELHKLTAERAKLLASKG